MKCCNFDCQGRTAKDCPKKMQSLSAVENPAHSSDVTTGATGTDSVEQLRIQIPNCPGKWHRQWCSEISSSYGQDTWLPRRERQRDRTCVHVCHWRTCDRPKTTRDSGHCRWQSAWFAHTSGPSSSEPHQCSRHVCSRTSSRLRLRQQQQRRESCGQQADLREKPTSSCETVCGNSKSKSSRRRKRKRS